LLIENKTKDAKSLLQIEYPHKHIEIKKRSYTLKEKMEQFLRDGFIDRYTGKKLVNPGILKVITYYFPEEFPYDPHWKMTRTHIAYWDLIPTIDHIFPIAQGGVDNPSNWATTSMKNNSIKSNYSLDEINWELHPSGSVREWDGLTKLFIGLVDQNKELLQDSYIKSWYKISKTVCSPSKKDIHAFAIKWVEKFSDSTIDYIEFVDRYMADDCEALGFKMDCGNSFSEIYGKAVFDYEELKLIINQISDISLLGSAIYSRWRYFNHWAYDAASILEEKNRKWFQLALNRLMQLSSQ
jgi:5-methylcytosine-specific restriction endonuclease McrA